MPKARRQSGSPSTIVIITAIYNEYRQYFIKSNIYLVFAKLSTIWTLSSDKYSYYLYYLWLEYLNVLSLYEFF